MDDIEDNQVDAVSDDSGQEQNEPEAEKVYAICLQSLHY